MGQKLGKASFCDAAESFVNLPAGAVESLWASFNLKSEGWGLGLPALTSITEVLAPFMGVDQTALAIKTEALFLEFDTDRNGLIDALEFMATLIMVSAMTPLEKFKFIYQVYDFSDSGALLIDEITLAVKSTITGLCKISKLDPPSLAEFEGIARLAFASAKKERGEKLPLADFTAYCSANPTALSWVAHFDDIADKAEPTPAGEDKYVMPSLQARGPEQAAAMAGLPPPTWGPESATTYSEEVLEQLKPEERVKSRSSRPDSQLEMEWVYGVSTIGRSHAHYDSNGGLIYPAGMVGVLHSVPSAEAEDPTPKQAFFAEHTDLITCLALGPSGKLYASGDCAADPRVLVWRTGRQGAALQTSVSGLPGPVRFVDISLDESKLLICCTDNATSLSVHSLTTGEKLWASTVESFGTVMDGRWTQGSKAFSLATAKGLVAFTAKGHGYDWKKGVMGTRAQADELVSLVSLGGHELAVAGGQTGRLFKWKGRFLEASTDGHTGPVTCLNYCSAEGGRLISGGLDGKAMVWDTALQAPLATLDLMHQASSMDRRVLSVCLSADASKALVATAAAELWELTAVPDRSAEGGEDGVPAEGGEAEGGEGGEGEANPGAAGKSLHEGPVVAGHFGGAVTGVAAAGAEAVTVGSDGTVRILSVEAKKVVRMARVAGDGGAAQAVAFSPDGSRLAVATAAAIEILDPSALDGDRIAKLKIEGSEGGVALVEFSADGNMLFAVDAQGKVGAFSAVDWNSVATVVPAEHGGEGTVAGVEASEDGHWLRITTDTPAVVVWSVADQKAATLSDVRAAGTKFPPAVRGKVAFEKQTACPAHCPLGDVVCAEANPAAALTVVGDVFGGLHLFHYPSTKPTGHSTWRGHAAPVAGAVFVGEGHVVSAGSQDLTTIQWRLEVDEQVDEPKQPDPEDGADEEELEEGEEREVVIQDAGEGKDEDLTTGEENSLTARGDLFRAITTGDVAGLEKLRSEGDEAGLFAAHSNWLAGASDADPAAVPPEDGLQLDWVYGASLQATRGAVRYNHQGKIVYPAGSLGVVLDKTKATQRYLCGHSEAITCLAVHPDGDLVATGQRGPCPTVLVSSSSSSRSARRFVGPENSGAVSAVAFSPDGALLAFTTQDPQNTLHVYHWRQGVLKAAASSGPNKVLSLAFSPNSKKILAGGVDHFNVWSIQGHSVTVKRGLFGPGAVKQALLSAAWIAPPAPEDGEEDAGAGLDGEGGFAVLGGADGSLYKVEGRAVADVSEKLHAGALTSLYAFTPAVVDGEEGPCLATGGRDGVVKLLGRDLEPRLEINLRDKTKYTVHRWAVRSVCLNRDRRKVLIGTAGSEIFEISANEDAVDLNDGALVTGHCRGELTGVATHPIVREAASVGVDGTLRLWSMEERCLSRSLVLPAPARCVAYRPDGYLLAVGMDGEQQGSIAVVSALKTTLEVVKQLADANAPVAQVKFSPDGKVLAAATDAGERSELLLYDCLHTTEPGGAFTLRSRFELYSVSCGAAGVGQDDASAATQASNSTTLSAKERRKKEESRARGEIMAVEDIEAAYKGMQQPDVDLPPDAIHLPTSPPRFDFSRDSATIQYATNKGVVHVNVVDGNWLPGGAPPLDPEVVGETKGEDSPLGTWASWTCPIGQPVAGALEPCSAAGDLATASASQDRTLLATGDAFGRVNVLRFPGSCLKMPKASYRGHAGTVSEVCFSFDDDLVVSGGSEDRCVMQWQRTRCRPSPSSACATSSAVTVAASTAALPSDGALDFVYGVSPEVVGGVAYSRTEDVVCAAGALGLIFSKQRRTQCQVRGHTTPIHAMATSPDARFTATGDAEGKVLVWDANAGGEVRSELPKQLPGASIAALAFSPDGRRLVAVGGDVQHTVVVWDTASGDWTDGMAWAMLGSGPRAVKAVAFLGPHNDAFATVGEGAPLFWQLHGQNLTRQVGDWGAQEPAGFITAVAPLAEDRDEVVVGTDDGRLLVWQAACCVQAVGGHTGAVTGVLSLPTGEVGCVSCGDDSHIKVWRQPPTVAAPDGDEEEVGEGAELLSLADDFDLAASGTLTGDSRLATIAVDASFTKLLVITRGAELLEVVWDSRSTIRLLSGHAGASQSAPAPHPTDADIFATGGADGWVKVWVKQSHEQVASTHLATPLAAVGWSTAGDCLVAVGGNGRAYSLSFTADTLQLEQSHVLTDKLAVVPQRSVAASADGKVLQIDGGEAHCDAVSGEKLEGDAGAGAAGGFPATTDPKLEGAGACVFQLA